MIQATQLRKGHTILLNKELHQVVDYQHITPGNWRGMVQTKLRKLSTGAIIEHRFRSEDRVERAVLDEREMEYLYKDGTDHYFMDTENYEQLSMPRAAVEDALPFMQPSSIVQVMFVRGDPSGVDLPSSVVLEVTDTEPGVKGDTVSNVTKPATLETGAVVAVPLFVNVGDKIKVDPREKRYIQRA